MAETQTINGWTLPANDSVACGSGDVFRNYVTDVLEIAGAQVNSSGVNTATANTGTAATGTTAVERGNSAHHLTILTVDTTLPSIAGGADLAVGKLLYTFPTAVIQVRAARMSMAIQQTDGKITSDTPDGGLGTTIASGAEALLSSTGAFENILTGQTFGDCDGTAKVASITDQILTIESGGDQTVYFNVADGWAADGDSAAELAGTVILDWVYLG